MLQNSNIFSRSREILFFVLFGYQKEAQFSGCTSNQVSYLRWSRSSEIMQNVVFPVKTLITDLNHGIPYTGQFPP